MNTKLKIILLAVAVCGQVFQASAYGEQRLYDVKNGTEITLQQAVPDLRRNRLILVGEYHSFKHHHQAQLRVIKALREAGVKVAIGLEMFRSDSQTELDQWVTGETSPKDFQKVFYDNWSFTWPTYSMIFEYARKHRLPMIGLNVPRRITRQVAQHGFASLSPEQKGRLENVTCEIGPKYENYIRQAYGAHGHGRFNFNYFCEAQLVWDKVMALRALEYLSVHPDTVMVLLAGTGHTFKRAIPAQIRAQSDIPLAVLVPHDPKRITPQTVAIEDADYILMAP